MKITEREKLSEDYPTVREKSKQTNKKKWT